MQSIYTRAKETYILQHTCNDQWRNRWGAECPTPETSDQDISADFREKKGKEKSDNVEKRRIIERGEVENWKWKEEKWEHEERTFFFFFFFFFFCLLLFTFKKEWNLFWVYQNRNSLMGKKHFTPGKNQQKWLFPLWKIFLLRPWQWLGRV